MTRIKKRLTTDDLPDLNCERCGACCGDVLMTQEEADRIAEYCFDNGIATNKEGEFLSCPFLFPDGCHIYPVRPMICRLFGHAKKLICCKGHNKPLDRKFEREIAVPYMKKCKKRGTISMLDKFPRTIHLNEADFKTSESDEMVSHNLLTSPDASQRLK